MVEPESGCGAGSRRPGSSPPCMAGEGGEGCGAAAAEPMPPGHDWAEIRAWRKVKRSRLIERRMAMSAADRATRGEAITASLLSLLCPADAGAFGFYWPFKGEYDPRPVAYALHERGVRLALPVVAAKGQPLAFLPWRPGVPMKSGIWGIPVPAEGEPVLPATLLVPLVGFDRQRYRLGYGGGFYDRTLAVMPARPRTVGIAFELSQIPTIYPQAHDIRMDLIVTERGVA